MQKQEIYQQIRDLLVKLFELDADDIKPESLLYEDLDLDSIDAVDLVVHLQKITGRKIKPEMFKSVKTVQDVVDAIDQTLESEQPE
ncbi:MAG: acyl carrier protein [Rouxiella aceris]|uniref:acyl carrier protein n=1 Tax=Rouxiella aceris TaxID=2703884 RepID=UPI0028441460|nr:acyl carrier protein [Rouxiella aceris]MDR3432165.1 acyl carrier protein [Rouxiella aceris]